MTRNKNKNKKQTLKKSINGKKKSKKDTQGIFDQKNALIKKKEKQNKANH